MSQPFAREDGDWREERRKEEKREREGHGADQGGMETKGKKDESKEETRPRTKAQGSGTRRRKGETRHGVARTGALEFARSPRVS